MVTLKVFSTVSLVALHAGGTHLTGLTGGVAAGVEVLVAGFRVMVPPVGVFTESLGTLTEGGLAFPVFGWVGGTEGVTGFDNTGVVGGFTAGVEGLDDPLGSCLRAPGGTYALAPRTTAPYLATEMVSEIHVIDR